MGLPYSPPSTAKTKWLPLTANFGCAIVKSLPSYLSWQRQEKHHYASDRQGKHR